MGRYLAIILLGLALSACANLSKNRVLTGEVVLVGGVAGERIWKDHLAFQRVTWLHELSMWLDMGIVELSQDSPFFHWASGDEKKLILSCQRFRLLLTYALDSRKLSDKDLLAQLEKQGQYQVLVPRLAASVHLHPDFDRLGLDRHKIYGLCQRGPSLPIVLDFPGFAPARIP